MPEEVNKNEELKFESSRGIMEVNDKKYAIRVLKMIGSTLLFICDADNECLNEMAIAMPMPNKNNNKSKDIIGTTVIGDSHITSSSQQLAEKLSKRFMRQFFVSHNVSTDVLDGPIFERALGDYVRTNTHKFI